MTAAVASAAAYGWNIVVDFHYVTLEQQLIGLVVVDGVLVVDECSYE